MALTAARRYSTRGGDLDGVNSYRVQNGEVIYYGALVAIDTGAGASGDLVNLNDDSGALQFVGIAVPDTDSVTGNTSASPAVQCKVNESGLTLEGVSVTGVTGQPNVGDPVYATDENTLTVSATPNIGSIGRIVRWISSTTCDVQLFSAMEYRANQDIGQV